MKAFTTIGILILFSFITVAQPPQGINYQTVVRNVSGNIISNSSVSIKIAIHSGSTNGSIVYAETHNLNTNQFGLINFVIGQGTPVTGTFAGINWGNNNYFAETLIDINGGTSYVSVGTQQLMSVPYALYAGKSNESQSLALNGNILSISNGNSVTLPTINSNSNNFLKQFTTTGYLLTTRGIECMTSTNDGEILIVALAIPNTNWSSGILRLEKDQSGIYHTTHFSTTNTYGIRHMTILNNYIYFVSVESSSTGIKRMNLSDLGNVTDMTLNPSAPSTYGVISNDGTNILLQTTNTNFNNDWIKYQIISTALINTNQNFTFDIAGDVTHIGSDYCIYDGQNYLVSYYNQSLNKYYIAKFNQSKTFISQSEYSSGDVANFSGDYVVNGDLLIGAAFQSYLSINPSQTPVIITIPFHKP